MAGARHDSGGRPSEFYSVFDAEQRVVQYVYAIGSYHYNWHPAVELSVLLTGEVEVCVDGTTRRLLPGDLCLINSNVGHATLAVQPESMMLLLHVEPAYVGAILHADASGPWDITQAPRATRAHLRLLLARMMRTPLDGSGPRAAYLRDLFDLLATLSPFATPAPATPAAGDPEAPSEALSRAVDYVDKHFRERVTLPLLGRAAGYNPTYLSQLFSARLGMSPSAYLTRVRLREATRDLGDPRLRVADVAAANGFPDVKAFNLAFRRTYGKSPTDYRKLLTAETAAVDPYFRKRFARRDDAVISTVLEEFAEGPVTEPAPTVDLRDDLTTAAAAARALADQLTDVADHLG